MANLLIARLRHFILGPGKHRRRSVNRPEVGRIAPLEFVLMFSGQSADTKYYPQKNGVSRELRFW